MAKRILIIGSTGMLGHQVLRRLEEFGVFEIFDIVHSHKRRKDSLICDVTDFDYLTELIKSIRPEVIINCVGILVKGSEESIVNAIKVNALLPHALQAICDEIDSKLIHISTDCVFSGHTGSYVETSTKNATDVYGITKGLGEIVSRRHLTIRTSIVGPELKQNGVGLLHWFLTVNESQIKGYSNVFWGGVTTFELSKVILFAIENNISGLWNVTNGKAISKYSVLRLFNELLGPVSRRIILDDNSKKSDKSLKSLRADIGYSVPSYEVMFAEMWSDILRNKFDYSFYQRAISQ